VPGQCGPHVPVKQAQCRMKMLAKLQEERVDVDFDDPYLRLNFPHATPLPPPCISVMNAAFGYEGYQVTLNPEPQL